MTTFGYYDDDDNYDPDLFSPEEDAEYRAAEEAQGELFIRGAYDDPEVDR